MKRNRIYSQHRIEQRWGRWHRWWLRERQQQPVAWTIFSRREIYAARAIRYDDGSICAWRLLITFLSLKGITTRRRVTSLTRLKARNWFSSGANPTRRDRVHSNEKEGWLLAPVHRRLLNQSDMASGMHRSPRLPLATSVLQRLFLQSKKYFDVIQEEARTVFSNLSQLHLTACVILIIETLRLQ